MEVRKVEVLLHGVFFILLTILQAAIMFKALNGYYIIYIIIIYLSVSQPVGVQ